MVEKDDGRGMVIGFLVAVVMIILMAGLLGSCSNSSSSSSSSYDEPKTQSQLDNDAIEEAGQKLDNVIKYEESKGN